MWPFLGKDKPKELASASSAEATVRRPMKFAEIVQDMGDFGDLKRHDATLKLWLPESAVEALRDLCMRNGDSVSEALRQFFCQHCYGLYAFEAMN